MKINSAIFDMDGLLIDSEPLWKIAADHLFNQYGKQLSEKQYAITTGLRTSEFLSYWFNFFQLPDSEIMLAEKNIITQVMNLVQQQGKPMPGVEHIFSFFKERNFKIGLASSSPPELINLVVDLLGIRNHLNAVASASQLDYGKPHPEVYLQCAEQMGVKPRQSICFEDSFNGMIAAKAACMKCIVVPSKHDFNNPAWEAADLKIASLYNFNGQLYDKLK